MVERGLRPDGTKPHDITQEDKRAHHESQHFHLFQHAHILGGQTEEMQRIDGFLPGGRTIEAILASAREARARLPAAREGPGPDAAAAAAADAVRVAGRRATKPRSEGGRGARHLQLGGRIKARVINAMLWPPSTINALS